MSFIMVGTSHKYCPIEIREEIVFFKKGLRGALLNLLGRGGFNGAVIISTCNRVELYAQVEEEKSGIDMLKDFLSGYHRIERSLVTPYLYAFIGKKAILHLFKVTSGLDSQILGEEQILGQVRFAYEEAQAIGATDGFLDALFNQAVRTALRVRRETQISAGNISLGSAVVDLLKDQLGFIRDKKVLILGVGKISQILVQSLRREGVRAIFIANRTYAKAVSLAKEIDAEVISFAGWKGQLKDADIIISATSCPHILLRKEDFKDISRPRLIIDLSVPRDVEPGIRAINGITLFYLDDLDFIIQKKLTERFKEVPKALTIIEQEADNLCIRENLAWEREPVLWQ